MAADTTATLDNLLSSYLDRLFLTIFLPRLVYHNHGTKKTLPKKEGTSITWSSWRQPAAASVVIAEATTPTEFLLSARSVSATLRQYARWTKIGSLVNMVAITDVVDGAVKLLARVGAETVDNDVRSAIFKPTLAKNIGSKILSAMMSATASSFCLDTGTHGNEQFGLPVVFATSATRLSAVGVTAATVNASARLGLHSIRKVVKALETADAEPYPDGFFHSVIGPDAKARAMSDPHFVEWNRSFPGGVQKMENNVLGELANVRFFLTTKAPAYRGDGGTNHSCDLVPVFGQDTYGVVDFDGGVSVYVKRPGVQDTSNPVNMFSTVGAKVIMTSKVLNPSVGRILVCHNFE